MTTVARAFSSRGVLGWSAVVQSGCELLGPLKDDVRLFFDSNLPQATWTAENAADPRLAKYVRAANTDEDGNSLIRDIAPGEYYVEGELNWTSSHLDTDQDGIETLMYTDHSQRIFARVSVRKNQTVRILEWNQLSPTRGSFYSYGGTFTRPHYRLLN